MKNCQPRNLISILTRPIWLFFRQISIILCITSVSPCTILSAQAYPIFAQKSYNTPIEETGQIVCANCHLAQKPVELELPQSILPSQVFFAHAEIPVNQNLKQVLGNGKPGPLNVGGVVILPDHFQLAPPEKRGKARLPFQMYSTEHPNMYVVGPIPSAKNAEFDIPLIAPKKDELSYGTYSVYFGGNRGRGQIYPDGSKSNNTSYTSPVNGVVDEIIGDKKGQLIVLMDSKNDRVEIEIPFGPTILVKKGDSVIVDQLLTNNPNVGGFGQIQHEIVFQSPTRLITLQLFLWSVLFAQILLVLKKKQVEITAQI